MKYNKRGVFVDDVLRHALASAVANVGGVSELSRRMDVDRGIVAFLKGTETRTAKSISWGVWPNIRDYLLTSNLISREYTAGDPTIARKPINGGSYDSPPAGRISKTDGKETPMRDGVMLASAKFVTAVMGAEVLDDSQKVAVIKMFKSFFPDDAEEFQKAVRKTV